MKRITIYDNEEFLRSVSSPVEKGEDINSITSALKDYCENNAVFALAPVQIGIPKRVIYIKNSTQNSSYNNIKSGYNEEIIYINPKIISMEGETEFLEACDSVRYFDKEKNDNIYQAKKVTRPYKLKVEYSDTELKKHTKTIEGFEATIFCHEYDHLNGIIHIDRNASEKVVDMTINEVRKYREKNPYLIISKDGKFTYR